MSDAATENLYAQAAQWQQQRRKPETSGVPIAGFSPPPGIAVRMTLWLPASKTETRVEFVDGRPQVIELTPDADPELAQLRAELIFDITHPREGVISVGLSFLAYAAALIRKNYAVSDAEMAALLEPGEWRQAVIEHAVGGDDFVQTINRSTPELLQTYEMAAGLYPTPADPSPRPRRIGFLRRLAAAFWPNGN